MADDAEPGDPKVIRKYSCEVQSDDRFILNSLDRHSCCPIFQQLINYAYAYAHLCPVFVCSPVCQEAIKQTSHAKKASRSSYFLMFRKDVVEGHPCLKNFQNMKHNVALGRDPG